MSRHFPFVFSLFLCRQLSDLLFLFWYTFFEKTGRFPAIQKEKVILLPFGTLSVGQKKVHLFALLACLLGLAAVIVGVTLLNTPTESARDGGGLAFGADFYTEMHGITRDVFLSTLRMHESINLGLGFLLITLGGFGICAFAPQIVAAPSHTCPHCGAPMKQGQAFCQACGQPQSGSSAAPDASPYPPHP